MECSPMPLIITHSETRHYYYYNREVFKNLRLLLRGKSHAEKAQKAVCVSENFGASFFSFWREIFFIPTPKEKLLRTTFLRTTRLHSFERKLSPDPSSRKKKKMTSQKVY